MNMHTPPRPSASHRRARRFTACIVATFVAVVVVAPAAWAAPPDAPLQPAVVSGDGQITVTFTAPADGGSPITSYTATCTSSNGGTTGTLAATTSPISRHRARQRQDLYVRGVRHQRRRSRHPVARLGSGGPEPGTRRPGATHGLAGRLSDRGVLQPAVRRRERDHRVHGVLYLLRRRRVREPDRRRFADQRHRTHERQHLHVHRDRRQRQRQQPAVGCVGCDGAERHAECTRQTRSRRRQRSDHRVVLAAGQRREPDHHVHGDVHLLQRRRDGHTIGTSSPITVTGLDNGKAYTCTVVATNANGDSSASPPSASVTPARAPDAPSQPGAVAGDAAITVTFTPPFDGGSAITGYTANCTSANGGAAGSNTGSGSPIVVSGLTDGRTYTCTVVASNVTGDSRAIGGVGFRRPEPRTRRARATGRQRGQRPDHRDLQRPVQRRQHHYRLRRQLHLVQRRHCGDQHRRELTDHRRQPRQRQDLHLHRDRHQRQRQRTRLTRVEPGRTEHHSRRADATGRECRQRPDHRDLRRPVRRRQRDHRLHRDLHVRRTAAPRDRTPALGRRSWSPG